MSSKRRKHLRDLLFYEQTLTRRDFRDLDLKSVKDSEPVERPKHVKKREKSKLKYLETCQDYKGEPVSFSLYIRPHPILGVNPRAVQKHFGARIDEGRKEAQKSRPRLVISPGAAIDDIQDDEIRNLVVVDTYESNKSKADRIVMANVERCTIKAPMGDTYAPPRALFLPNWRPPVALPEWRMESRYWDLNNLRGHANPDEEFWLRKA